MILQVGPAQPELESGSYTSDVFLLLSSSLQTTTMSQNSSPNPWCLRPSVGNMSFNICVQVPGFAFHQQISKKTSPKFPKGFQLRISKLLIPNGFFPDTSPCRGPPFFNVPTKGRESVRHGRGSWWLRGCRWTSDIFGGWQRWIHPTQPKPKNQMKKNLAWQFFVTFLGSLSDPFKD